MSYLYSDALEDRRQAIIRDEFEETTWQAFQLCVVEDRSPQDVAAELEMSVAAVYQAKSRVLRRLGRELEGRGEVSSCDKALKNRWRREERHDGEEAVNRFAEFESDFRAGSVSDRRTP